VVLVETAVRTPVDGVMLKTEMLLEFWLPTKSNFPVVSFTMKIGEVPAGYGGTGVAVIAFGTPLVASIVNAYTLFPL